MFLLKSDIYSKKSGNYYVISSKETALEPFVTAMEEVFDDYFTLIVNEYTYDKYHDAIAPLLNDHDKEILNSYNPDNNPIIVMFKFKDF